MKKCVIFGASKGGEKVFYTLNSIGIEVSFFVDNNSKKWETSFLGKQVHSPNMLYNKDVFIIIAAEEYQEGIEQQLCKMGLSCNIKLKEDFLLPYTISFAQSFPKHKINSSNETRVFIELLEGCPKGSGGIVSWSINVAKLLQASGINAQILCSNKYGFPEGNEAYFVPYESDFSKFWESVIELVDFITNHLPCIIITNKQLQMLYAGIIVKQKYPDKIKLYSAIHSDLIALYRRAVKIEPYIDLFLCTTRTNKIRLSDIDNFPIQKLSYKGMPISNSFFIPHTLLNDNQTLRIGWGGRLVRSLKRADLIIPLIQELENMEIDYILYIAGSGECFNEINNYIKENRLHGTILLLGQLKREEMPCFWSNVDISICLSEREGACLSLLESMACGAVPITTKHNSAEEIIQHGTNGYIVPQGDCNAIARYIKMLTTKRQLLFSMQKEAVSSIRENHDEISYQHYLLSLLK